MSSSVKAESVLPGVQTVVTDKSMLNLPTGVDREKESVLPSEQSATPRSHDDRFVSKYEYNRPDNDIDKRPRTLGEPGREYGHPSKDDYGMPTRRSMTAYSSGRPQPSRQRKQMRKKQKRDHVNYHKNRSQRQRNALFRYHHFCKRNQRCMTKRKMYREDPSRYKRKNPVSEATRLRLRRKREKATKRTETRLASGLGFHYRPFDEQGVILRIAHEHVLFAVDGDVGVLPVAVFSRVAAFDSEASFRRYVDAVVTVPDLDAATVHGVGALYDVDTRDFDFGPLTPAQLRLACDVLTGDADGDGILRLARLSKSATGDVIMFDRAPPNKDINRPGEDVAYDVSGPDITYKTVDEKGGVPKGQGMPDTHTDDVPAASPRVTPNGQGQFFSGETTYLQASARFKMAVLMKEIRSKVPPDVISKSRSIKPRLQRVDEKNGIYTFQVPSSEGAPYTVKLRPVQKGTTTDLQKLDVLVSCSCPFFQWQGPEHWAKVNGFLYGKPWGTASTPDVKDPKKKHWACKHVISVFDMAERYGYQLPGKVKG